MIVRVKSNNPTIFRSKTVIRKEDKYNEFIGLIEWASNRYSAKVPYSYISQKDFVGAGHIVLSKCLEKWGNRGSSKEFAKYFKTSLFNAYKNMLAKIYSHKRRAKVEYVEADEVEELSPVKIFYPSLAKTVIFRPKRSGKKLVERVSYPNDKSIDDIGLKARCDDFSTMLYDDLVRHVSDQITNDVEKKIFMFIADPPEDLCDDAIIENRRKLKASIRGMVNGVHKVKVSGGIIIKYLKRSGEVVSRGQYQTHLKNIRDKVKEIMKEE
jgi:hypothetical protein